MDIISKEYKWNNKTELNFEKDNARKIAQNYMHNWLLQPFSQDNDYNTTYVERVNFIIFLFLSGWVYRLKSKSHDRFLRSFSKVVALVYW